MRNLLSLTAALLAMALMPSAPAGAAGVHAQRLAPAGLASPVEKVRHRFRHRHIYGYGSPRSSWYAYRYYVVPGFAYQPYYYTAWRHRYAGVYVAPRPDDTWRYRRW